MEVLLKYGAQVDLLVRYDVMYRISIGVGSVGIIAGETSYVKFHMIVTLLINYYCARVPPSFYGKLS